MNKSKKNTITKDTAVKKPSRIEPLIANDQLLDNIRKIVLEIIQEELDRLKIMKKDKCNCHTGDVEDEGENEIDDPMDIDLTRVEEIRDLATVEGKINGHSVSVVLDSASNKGTTQFNFEHQWCERCDHVTGTIGAIGLGRWNHQSPFRPDRHVLQCAAPSGDHAVETEPLWLTVLIEHRAVGQAPDVQHLHLAVRSGFGASAWCQLGQQHAISQFAYAGSDFLCGEKTLFFFQCHFALRLG